jgi:hypothetical protein
VEQHKINVFAQLGVLLLEEVNARVIFLVVLHVMPLTVVQLVKLLLAQIE